MLIFSSITELRSALKRERDGGRTLAFVPTMGNLHTGHLDLVTRAKTEADLVIVSIFVNPLQFGANEDLAKYPRTPEEDIRKLVEAGVNFLFMPDARDIYPEGMEKQTKVSVPGITADHCGKSRPGHFDGVSTVVAKLFQIVQPEVAIFGQKDFQQLAVIRKMVLDLCMPIRIIGQPTSRAADGLALSSRNQYLNEEQRKLAPLLYQTLKESQDRLLQQKEDIAAIEHSSIKILENHGFKTDYFHIRDAVTLDRITAETKEIVILVAAFLGSTRLIDNLSLAIEPPFRLGHTAPRI